MTMDKLKMHSVNKIEENIAAIGRLFPNCLTERMGENGEIETAIDFDALKQELSSAVVEGKTERYQFIWPDKRMAVLAANAPTASTLRPVVAESVGKDGTAGGFDSENLYIEGDNLDVLKLLQETYLGKIRLIYIDPPYNTEVISSITTILRKRAKPTLRIAVSMMTKGTNLCRTRKAMDGSTLIGSI